MIVGERIIHRKDRTVKIKYISLLIIVFLSCNAYTNYKSWYNKRPVSYTHLDVYKRQIQDKPNHVSVMPASYIGTLQEWIDTGASHPCTLAVKSVVVKWDGEY